MDNKRTFEQELSENGKLIYTNVGVSMRPLIREGRDILVIEKRSPESIKRYDAVLFKRANIKGRGEYVLHRIVKILPNGDFYIVGDNATKGEIVKPSQILGVLTGLNHAGRQVNLKGFKYRLYVYLWCAPYHLRFSVLHTKHFLSFIFGSILHKLKVCK